MTEHNYLKIDRILNFESLIQYGDHELIQLYKENESSTLALLCSYSEFEIPVNFIFKYLINQKDKITFNLDFNLKYVSVWSRKTKVIPIGYLTVCLFEVLEKEKIKTIVS